MLDRLTCLFLLATAPLGCGSNEHCIGDCEPQSSSSATAGPATTSGGGTSTTAEEGTTADAPTTGTASTTAEATTTGGPGPATCRDAVACAAQCVVESEPPPPGEEGWQACVLAGCAEDLSNVEWLKLFDLTECVQTKCATACMAGEEPCQQCVMQGLGDMLPPGDECEAPAEACD
ncbi:hypothetical protein [Nannocystis punicea]|uniref:Uncharacterized protein n=1 Tax=Nannocystis punicea TaxID=2995304 RepID=A0ABY7H8D4_9BACT|nr:hypothetical protein [Nannocystis poenicansa]WAS95535.1 hypothetical protein O0S08_05180 [Nannocystis poenicansa]